LPFVPLFYHVRAKVNKGKDEKMSKKRRIK